MDNDQNVELLRSGVFEYHKILNCDIYIDVHKDLKWAKYKYCYTLKILKSGLNQWREIFDYKISDVYDISARDKVGGLKDTTENVGKYTQLTIDFRNHLLEGQEYYFEYNVETKIESISKIHKLLGGSGAIWFWCSHEFFIEAIAVHLKFPNKISITGSHPNGEVVEEDNDGQIEKRFVINKVKLNPSEFFSGIIQVEKRIFGLNPAWGDRLNQIFWIVVGAIISLGIELILKI